MPPPKLALRFQRLLPILYKRYQHPLSGYSKAPWGLSVLSRVTCIFTGTIISPSLSLRQCPDRYAFRAGRNLPDKEFRSAVTNGVGGLASLHVAMQIGPYLHSCERVFGVWPLRILMMSSRGTWRFMVCATSSISAKPSRVRCRPADINSRHCANLTKSTCFAVRN